MQREARRSCKVRGRGAKGGRKKPDFRVGVGLGVGVRRGGVRVGSERAGERE